MNRMLGYLIGKPKILDKTQLNYNFLKNTDGYFIRVKITKVGKHRQFPLMSKYNDNGVRMFTNDMTNQIIYTVVAMGSLSSGAFIHFFGWDWVNIGALPLLVIAVGVTFWYFFRQKMPLQKADQLH